MPVFDTVARATRLRHHVLGGAVFIAVLAVPILLTGCGGSNNPAATSTATPTPTATATPTPTATATPIPSATVAVSLTPTAVTLVTGGMQMFTASVTNTSNESVTWSIQEGAAGGTITSAGVYTAPVAAGTYHVVATSVADGTKTAVATVTVQAPATSASITVSPVSVTLAGGATQTFTAVVSNSTNQSVTWTVQEGATGGTITSAGVYTAPTTPGTYHVVATSAATASVQAVATVTVEGGSSTVTVQ